MTAIDRFLKDENFWIKIDESDIPLLEEFDNALGGVCWVSHDKMNSENTRKWLKQGNGVLYLINRNGIHYATEEYFSENFYKDEYVTLEEALSEEIKIEEDNIMSLFE